MSGATTPRAQSPSRHPSEAPFNARNAALQGASSAFAAKPPVKPKPKLNVADTSQGALLAATRVGKGNGDTSTPRQATSPGGPLTPQSTGGPKPRKRWSQASLDVPAETASTRSLSPSNVAANVAAARLSPQSQGPRPTLSQGPSHGRNLSQTALRPPGDHKTGRPASIAARGFNDDVVDDPSKPTDTSSIPPTNALVQMFEKTDSQGPHKAKGADKRRQKAVTPPLKSPKPVRRTPPQFVGNTTKPVEPDVGVLTPPDERQFQPQAARENRQRNPPKISKPSSTIVEAADNPQPFIKDGRLVPEDHIPSPAHSAPPRSVSIEAYRGTNESRAVVRPKDPKIQAPSLKPKTRPPVSTAIDRPSPPRNTSSMDSATKSGPDSPVPKSPQSAGPLERTKPSLPPPRRGRPVSRDDEPVPPLPPPRTLGPNSPSPMKNDRSPPRSIGRSSLDPSGGSSYQRESIRQITPHMTGESLANAMVAGALASSRPSSIAPTPTRSPAPYSLPWNNASAQRLPSFANSRTPSPGKPKQAPAPSPMRKTLRRPPSSSSDEERTKRTRKPGLLQRKHPNKHHEGDRKRWRDSVTAREKKRYDGVWAANRGLYLTSSTTAVSSSADEVANVVVRELWLRSRLPSHVLEEIWDLVDTRGVGRLTREEFVVGLWLVDQRLKGRKLPPKVLPSVWSSVKGVGAQVRLTTG